MKDKSATGTRLTHHTDCNPVSQHWLQCIFCCSPERKSLIYLQSSVTVWQEGTKAGMKYYPQTSVNHLESSNRAQSGNPRAKKQRNDNPELHGERVGSTASVKAYAKVSKLVTGNARTHAQVAYFLPTALLPPCLNNHLHTLSLKTTIMSG